MTVFFVKDDESTVWYAFLHDGPFVTAWGIFTVAAGWVIPTELEVRGPLGVFGKARIDVKFRYEDEMNRRWASELARIAVGPL